MTQPIKEKANARCDDDETSAANQSTNFDQNCSKQSISSVDKRNKICNEYLDLLKTWSHKKVSQTYRKTEKPSQKESKSSHWSRASKIQTEETTKKNFKSHQAKKNQTVRVKNRATQFETIYGLNDDDLELSTPSPKEIWPSWFSKNNKQVQTDISNNGSQRISFPSQNNEQSLQASSSMSGSKSSNGNSGLCISHYSAVQSPQKQPFLSDDQSNYSSSKCNCVNFKDIPGPNKPTFITSFEEPIQVLHMHYPNQDKFYEHEEDKAANHNAIRQQCSSLVCTPDSNRFLICQSGDFAQIIEPESTPKQESERQRKEKQSPRRKINEKYKPAHHHQFSSSDGSTKVFKIYHQRTNERCEYNSDATSEDETKNFVPPMNSIHFHRAQKKYHQNHSYKAQTKSKEQVPESSKLSPILPKKLEDTCSWNDVQQRDTSISFPVDPLLDSVHKTTDNCRHTSTQKSEVFSNRDCSSLPRISGYCWSPVYYIENNRPNTAHLVPILNPSCQNITLEVDVEDCSARNSFSHDRKTSSTAQRWSLSSNLKPHALRLEQSRNFTSECETLHNYTPHDSAYADLHKISSGVPKNQVQSHVSPFCTMNVVLNQTKLPFSQRKKLINHSQKLLSKTNQSQGKPKCAERRFVRFKDCKDNDMELLINKRNNVVKQLPSCSSKNNLRSNENRQEIPASENTSLSKFSKFSSTDYDREQAETWKQNLKKQ